MIINDTETVIRKEIQTNRERDAERFLLGCEKEVKDAIHVQRINNAEERMGRPMWPRELETRLQKMNPNFVFEVIDNNPTHKRLSVVDQRGKHFVAVYENSLMPERSIPRIRTMEVPDPMFTHVDRKDFSSDPEALKPGWRRVQIPWGESKRGWRTVLVRLIQAGLLSAEETEREFGADQTPEWHQYTGKGEFTSPF